MNNEYGAVVRSAAFFVANSWQVLSEDADSFQEVIILFLLLLRHMVVYGPCDIATGVTKAAADCIETVSSLRKQSNVRMSEQVRMQFRINPMEYLIERIFFER